MYMLRWAGMRMLRVTGEIEVVTDQDIIDWLAQQKGPLTVATDMVMLKVMALKVKLVGEQNRDKALNLRITKRLG